jgi:hypothetical protein
MFDSDSDGFADRERDRVLNAETRRALRRAARLVGVAAVGVLTAAITLSFAAASAILSVPWQLHVAVTVIVALALLVVVPYAMLRVYGLATRDVVFVAKRASREIVAEIIFLSGPSTDSGAFDEYETKTDTGGTETAASAESPSADEMDTDESSTESEPTDLQQQAEPQS